VHFLGDRPREDVARLMQACDALLLTARSEGGGPRVVVEALASGLPVVSTRVVEVTRTVTTRGNGWLVDEPTPEALAEGLAWVLDQPHESFRTSTTTAASAFTARNVLSGLYATYRDLAGASGQRAGSDQE
jgi:glycosyltransferase involved in cell wall biosynthesis